MIPASQIVSNVRVRHNSESSVRWSDAGILLAINEGLEDLSEATRFYERHISVSAVNLRTYYDLRGWLPESALGVTSVWSTAISDWLIPTSVDRLGTRWEQSAGPSRYFFMRGMYWMGVWPKPETTVGSYRVYFSGYAPRFSHPQAVLRDLLDDYVPALEEYAMYELAIQDGESDRALAHFADYSARSMSLASSVNNRITTTRVLRMGSR